MPPAGFEPTFLVRERPYTHALDRAVTEIGYDDNTRVCLYRRRLVHILALLIHYTCHRLDLTCTFLLTRVS